MILEYSRSPSEFAWFDRELKQIDDGLRLQWGAERHGIQLWVIERRIPHDIHAACLEDFHVQYPGESRHFDQQLTDDHGNVIGLKHFDRVPEWALGHIIYNKEFDYDDPRAYREPGGYDIAAIRRWLFEYRNVAEQLRELREERERNEAANKEARVGILARDIKDARAMWGDTPIIDIGGTTRMEGTEI